MLSWYLVRTDRFWSIPRNLSLKTYPEGLRLIQTPVSQLEALRYNEITCKRNLEVGVHKVDFFTPSENSYELDFKFDVEKSNVFGLNLCVGNGRKVTISYDTDSYNLVIDRTNVRMHAFRNSVGWNMRKSFLLEVN